MGRWGCLAANRRSTRSSTTSTSRRTRRRCSSADTWHVQWIQLAWLWGFVIALVLVLLLWIWQYRSTRQKAGPYPVDSFGGYTTELAGPATLVLPAAHGRHHGLGRVPRRRAHRLGAEVLMAVELTPSAPSRCRTFRGRRASMAVIPAADWPLVFGSMQALKGHVQEYPGCQKLEAFVEPQGPDYRIHCYTVWDTPGAARGLPRARLHLRAHARRRRRDPGRAAPLDGEDLLMAEEQRNRHARSSATATWAGTSATRGRRWSAPGSSSSSSSCSTSAGR